MADWSENRSIFRTDTLRGVGVHSCVVYLLEFAGEDDAFAAAEARAAATDVAVLGPGVGTAESLSSGKAADLAYTHRASEFLGKTTASIEALVDRLEAVPLDREGPVAVRARDVRASAGVDTQTAERRLGQVLVDRGLEIDLSDPAHTLVALFTDGVGALGWEAVTTRREYGDRAPTDRQFFQPGSMDPLLARAVINLAGVEAGDLVLDPMCGTGGLLIEAGLVGARPIGIDAQEKMVRGARMNFRSELDGAPLVARGDATALPLPDDSVDAVVFDAPYGRQSKVETHDLEALVQGALREARRVAPRAVIVADRTYGALIRDAGWDLVETHERPVHRSLTRYVHVLR